MAAPIVSLEDVSLRQGDGLLFDRLSLFIGARDRLALIGRNGAGKTTLLRLVAGTLEPDRGRRVAQAGQRIVLLPQDPPVDGFATLRDYALGGPDAPAPHEVEAIADQLGVDLSLDAARASGGERRRAAIARALALAPDLLLLDEPTNHLDLEAIGWLEAWLTRYTGAFLVISHDRTFLTRLTRACLWLDRGQLRRQEVGFGGFEAWSDAVQAEEARAADKLDSKLAQEMHWLQRGVTARRRRNQGRLERLHAMRAARKAMLGAMGTAKLGLATDEVKSKLVIEAERVSKAFPAAGGSRTILKDFSIRIQRGDRIGIVGPNGAGKTTLLKLLVGEMEPDSGVLRRAATLNGITIDQQRRLMDPEKRVRDVLADGGDWIEVRGAKKHIQGYLKDYLFAPGLADAKVGSFSGGERSRLLLAREFARESNLLVLDEPTNDLDLETLDLLQEVIADYEGTVLIVSHDRDFLDRTTTMTIGLDGSGHAEVVAGGFKELEAVWRARADRARKAPERTVPSPPRAAAASAPRKLGFRDQHDLERLPAEIARLETAIAALDGTLADPDLYARDRPRFERLTTEVEALRQQLEAAEARWLEVAEKAEALGG